jgi:superfamily II DNA/RNA helicase
MDPRPTFADLGLPTPLVDELTSQGLIEPFPIQQATIADALACRFLLVLKPVENNVSVLRHVH